MGNTQVFMRFAQVEPTASVLILCTLDMPLHILVWLEYCMSIESDFAENRNRRCTSVHAVRFAQVELAAYVLLFVLVSTTVFLIFLLEAASDSAADIASAAIWEADLEYRDLQDMAEEVRALSSFSILSIFSLPCW